MTTLQELFTWCCERFPGAYISLDLSVQHHRAAFGHPVSLEAEYSLSISDILSVTAPTIPSLIEQATCQLKAKLDQRKAEATDVLSAMELWQM